MVLIIDRGSVHETSGANEASILTLVNALEAEGLDHRAALKKAARQLGLTRDEAYRRLMAERGK